ncbi:MAG: pilus assembly protein N-terminal domain-containing protein [Cohaesibacter sp.]|jgi:Flp pilus assembly secretin CpaC|nr:pilus assembly protein N-terminal domain-containing protein [Cohaesibacter sp.]
MKLAAHFLFLSLAGSLFTSPALAAQKESVIEVKVDRAKVMRVARPAAMVVIGNPAIADATIKDSQTLIITGKRYGHTNLIILDADGEPIADEILNVSAAFTNDVVVYRGATRRTLNCAPNCEPVYRIGDDPEMMKNLSEQFNQSFSDATAAPAQGVEE